LPYFGSGMTQKAYNILLLVLALAFAVLALFLFPLLVAVNWRSATALIAMAALTAPLHWGLMHESIHAKLFAGETWNRRAGRVLGIFIGLNWEMMRFGHLMHHRANRHSFDRPEDVAPGRSLAAAAPGYFFTLLGGGTLLNALAPLTVALPPRGTQWAIGKVFAGEDSANVKSAASRVFLDPKRRAHIHADFAASVAVAALAAWCWGAHWPVLAGLYAARWVMLSLLDNAPHYATPIDSGQAARNTYLPRALSWLVMNANLHGVHHEFSDLSWQELRRIFNDSKLAYDGSWLAGVLRQLRGPVRLARP
jgi:fatty acid desaturase